MEKPVQPVIPFQPPMPPVPPIRITLTDEELEKIEKSELITKWKELENYVNFAVLEKSDDKVTQEKLQLQQQEATRRENVLMMRLATKEQEMQELLTQVQELKQAQTPSAQQLQTMLIDPAVNLLFEKMKTELTETKDRLEQAQNDLSAWKFTPDSVTGKKLMGRCRTLIQENLELGNQLSQGRIAQLEAELALQKKYSEELKGSQDEMNEFVIQLDEEVEGMQATICVLQQQLKETKQHSDKLGMENQKLRTRIEELLSSRQTNNVSLDSSVNESVEHKRNSVRSPKGHSLPDKSSKQERTNDSSNREHSSASKRDVTSPSSRREVTSPSSNKRDIISPTSKHRELLSPTKIHEERMDVDMKKESMNSHKSNDSKKIDKETCDGRLSTKMVKVITRQSSENTKIVEPTSPQVSPPKGGSKTSFSISDLLSGGTDCVRKDEDSLAQLPSDHPTSEQGENGALNGEIDDSVI